jgi:hypothetical protein
MGGGPARTEAEEPGPFFNSAKSGPIQKFASRSPWLENCNVLTSCKGKGHPLTGHEGPEVE